ncbi:MAG: putative Ig domain-containing protein [Christensenellaceae bacterium]
MPTIDTISGDADYITGDTPTALEVEASVTDNGTLSYQWYKDGEAIDGAVGATYTPSIAAAGEIEYTVEVTNTNAGAITPTASITSDPITITVTTFAIMSDDTERFLWGTSGSFGVETNATASVTYALDGEEPAGVSIHATSGILTVPGTLELGSYSFEITAAYNEETASQDFTIVVYLDNAEMPTIITDPESETYKENDEIIALTVAANVEDGGVLSYQWYSNTSNSTSDGTEIQGETATSYTPPSTIGTNYYYVVVTNTNVAAEEQTATATSAVAAITVNALDIPEITSNDSTQVYYEEAGSFTVAADGAGITFSLDGAPTGISIAADTGIITIAATTAEGEHIFDIIAANEDGEDTQTFTLYVIRRAAETPVITVEPADAWYVVGESPVALSVSVETPSDGGSLSYQWYKDGVPIGGATNSTYSPDTGMGETAYYYVIVANTNENAEDRTTEEQSAVAEIEVVTLAFDSDDALTIDYKTADSLSLSTNAWIAGDVTYSLTNAPEGVTVNDDSLDIADTVQGGTHTFGITATYHGVTVTQSFTLTVTVTDADTPIITTQPEGATYKVGDTAEAMEVAVASLNDGGVLSYQWYTAVSESSYEGAVEIGSATSASYVPPTNVEGDFYYFVRVTNTNSNATTETEAIVDSDIVTISVRDAMPPVFTSSNTYTATYGTAATFDVIATGTVPIAYALSGTVPVGVSIDEDTGALSIGATLAVDSYTFTITASNEDGDTDQTFTLFVKHAVAETPVITLEPQSEDYVTGDTPIALTVTASAVSDGGSLSYQWYADDVEILNADEATYTPDITTVGETEYHVVVTNTSSNAILPATATSAIATIAVTTFDITSDDTTTAALGTEGTFTVTTNETVYSTVTYTFDLLNTPPAGVSINAATGEITIADTVAKGAYTFGIVASNDGEEAVQTFTLNVLPGTAETPVIAVQPQGEDYVTGDTPNALTVTANQVSDGGTLSYQWYQDGVIISGADEATYTPDISTAGTHRYTVVVTNTIPEAIGSTTASVTSTAAEINVTDFAITSTDTYAVEFGTTGSFQVETNETVYSDVSYDFDASELPPTGATIDTDGLITVEDTVDSGQYTFGIVVSNNDVDVLQGFTLRVGPKAAETPNIAAALPSLQALQNEPNVFLEVEATVTDAGGVLSYQWYENTVNSVTGGTAISGAINESYTAPTHTAGIKYYYVIVTNTNELAIETTTVTATSTVGSVSVTGPQMPAITKEPAGGVYEPEETVLLSVTAAVSDGGRLSYQWYRNAANSTSGGTAISGATDKEYTPSTADVGTMYYYVIVTNENVYGATMAAVSAIATVEVQKDEPGKDTAEVEVEIKPGAPDVSVKDETALSDNTLTDAEKEMLVNGEAVITIKVIIAPRTATTAEETALKEHLQKGETLGMTFDITIIKVIEKSGERTEIPVTTLNKPVELILEVPRNLQKNDRTFVVLSLHGEEAARHTTASGITSATFSADKFSLYALAYKDAASGEEGTGKPWQTGDGAKTMLYLVLALSTLLAMASVTLYLKKRMEK